MPILKRAVIAATFALAAFAAPAAALPVTPLSLTQDGFTVTFTSAPHANGFVVSADVAFVALQGNTLIELFDAGNELTIGFSQTTFDVNFDFALSTSGPGNLNWTAYDGGIGGTLTGFGSATATAPFPFAFAEGEAVINGIHFDTLVLTSPDAASFAIDNLSVLVDIEHGRFFDFETVPEPLTLALFGTGLLAAGMLRRRHRAL